MLLSSLTQNVAVCLYLLLLPSSLAMYHDVILISYHIIWHEKIIRRRYKDFSYSHFLLHYLILLFALLFLNRLPRTPLLASWKAFPLKFARTEIHCIQNIQLRCGGVQDNNGGQKNGQISPPSPLKVLVILPMPKNVDALSESILIWRVTRQTRRASGFSKKIKQKECTT